MTEKTKRTIRLVAAHKGVTPEYVEAQMKDAICVAMASPEPHAQALWKMIAPDGKEPDLDVVLEYINNRVNQLMAENEKEKNHQLYS